MNPYKYLESLIGRWLYIDWSYDYSDDSRVWKQGHAHHHKLMGEMFSLFGPDGKKAVEMGYSGKVQEGLAWCQAKLAEINQELGSVNTESKEPAMEPVIPMWEKLAVRLGVEGEATTKVLASANVWKVKDRGVVGINFPTEFYRENRHACKACIETLRGAARAKNLNAAYNNKGTVFYIGK